jgi:hypothetical protein
MADPATIIKQAFAMELTPFISSALEPYVASQGGVISTSSSSVRWAIEETAANTYTFQPRTPVWVDDYTKEDGTHVKGYERKATPIKVPIEENLIGLDNALDRGITMFIRNVQSKV